MAESGRVKCNRLLRTVQWSCRPWQGFSPKDHCGTRFRRHERPGRCFIFSRGGIRRTETCEYLGTVVAVAQVLAGAHSISRDPGCVEIARRYLCLRNRLVRVYGWQGVRHPRGQYELFLGASSHMCSGDGLKRTGMEDIHVLRLEFIRGASP